MPADSPGGGAAGGKVFKVVIKNAPTGDYTIDHFNNARAARNNDSFAELGGAAAPAPAPGEPPAEGPGDPPPAQAIELQVKVGKQSARKLSKSRKLPAKVTVSREVSSITGTLKRGRKVVGNGSLGTTSGTKTLLVKLPKKLRAGRHALTVTASDGQTSTTRTVKVKVVK